MDDRRTWTVETSLTRGTGGDWRTEVVVVGAGASQLASSKVNWSGPVHALVAAIPETVAALGAPIGDEAHLAELGELLWRWAAEAGGKGA